MDQPGETKSHDAHDQSQERPHKIQLVEGRADIKTAEKEMVELSGIEPLTS